MRPFLLVLACVLAAAVALPAQITQINAGALVNPQTTDFDTGAPVPGPISGNSAYFASFGLCNVAIINAPGQHQAGSDTLSSGILPQPQCLAAVNNQLALVTTGGAIDDHAPGSGWAVRLAPGTAATQFGLTVVDQVNHDITVETYLGGILQNSLRINVAGTFPNPPLYFEDLAVFDEVRFMNPVQNGGWAIDDLVFANILGAAGSCPPAPATAYQVNGPNGSLDLDGQLTSGFNPAVTRVGINTTVTLTLDSALSGPLHELVANAGSLVPQLALTPGMQTINLDPTGGLWLNGGLRPNFVPFPGTTTIPLSSTAQTLVSMQGIFGDPSSVDGFALTQGAQLEVVTCPRNSNFDNLATGTNLEIGWTNGSNGNMPWTVAGGSTSSTNTGPTSAVSPSNFLYCETSTTHPSTFSFDTCAVDITNLSTFTVDFQLSRIGATIAMLEVQIDDGNTGNFVTLPGGTFNGADPNQAQGATEWTPVSIPFLPTSQFVKFRFLYSGTTSFTGDIAIDDLSIN